MVMLETRIPETRNLELFSIRRTEKGSFFIRSELVNLDISQKEFSISSNGSLRSFRRHENGGGWVEEGQYVRPSVFVSKGAVIFLGTNLPHDVVAIYGTENGNSNAYANYE